MGAAAFDNLTPHPSLLSRRPGATVLPSFELPHPQASSLLQVPSTSNSTTTSTSSTSPSQKYPLPSNTTPPETSTIDVKVGSHLVSPSNHLPDNNSLNPFPLPSNQFPSYPQGYWANSPPYAFNSERNNPHPNSVPDGLSAYNHSQPYQSPLQGASSSSDLPPSHHQDLHHAQESHQQQSHQQQSRQNPQHSQAMANVMMNPHSNPGATSPVLPPPTQQQGLDAYGQKMYSGPSQSSPPSYQPYQSAPPSLHQPAASGSSNRISPPLQTQFPQFTRPPYPSYSLPAMTGPVMSNVHNPSSQMALLGSMQPNILPGFNSGHSAAASMHQMYGGQGHPHPSQHPAHGMMQQTGGPQTDRPFRCDQCPQSFSRNHDLKRHKRIHLAVKPFPCLHCDKSFSRKDALKRHILVKGCGRDHPGDSSNNATAAASTKEDEGNSTDPQNNDSN